MGAAKHRQWRQRRQRPGRIVSHVSMTIVLTGSRASRYRQAPHANDGWDWGLRPSAWRQGGRQRASRAGPPCRRAASATMVWLRAAGCMRLLDPVHEGAAGELQQLVPLLLTARACHLRKHACCKPGIASVGMSLLHYDHATSAQSGILAQIHPAGWAAPSMSHVAAAWQHVANSMALGLRRILVLRDLSSAGSVRLTWCHQLRFPRPAQKGAKNGLKGTRQR